MRISISLDDELYAKAHSFVAPETSDTDLIRQALETFVRVQAGKRLAALGGTADMEFIAHRPGSAPE
ncbi:type II toxin-antitoxin system VapB family antitoxin [Uliginosibacterium sediminicola]|uniref:Type II toxin-antitoxin system VapB family antitoxin n=1 Tax=Uliginosibacterium sediminicola TaxID=2024550 RepID=A0ABU9YYN1_9RHOO